MTTNSELLERREATIPRGVSTATPVFVARAENAELWDVEGRRYIDFAGGIAVLNVGHRHPKVIKAVQSQLDRYTHTAFQVAAYEPYIELAERLRGIAPFAGPAKTIFFTTGAEAVENAVKIARAATRRSAVIAFTGAFHGRTMLGSALTGKVSPYKRAYAPHISDIYHVPFPGAYGVTLEDSLRALDFLFAADVHPSRVAAFIIEPVQGEGGFHTAPPELVRALRKLCDEHGAVLIADEVQTGFARTGRMFGVEHTGVEPDLVCVAKSLAGGFPLSGVLGRAELMDAIDPGGLGGTYAGSPIACAAALAVLDVIRDEGLVERANVIGDRFKDRLRKLALREDLYGVVNVRGPGAMVAFDVTKGRDDRIADPACAKLVTTQALQNGLIVLNAGANGEAIRLLVPLTASDAVIDEGLACLERALMRESGA